jgi:predicted HicB family RNase H-like nuclease
MGAKLIQQINVRLSPELYEEFEKLARNEDRSMGELARMVLEWFMPELKRSGSTKVLTAHAPRKGYSRRVSEELQDELHAALDLIFERAPSTVIERVTEFLTERAGKYAGSK